MKRSLLMLALLVATPAYADETLVLLIVDGVPLSGEPRMLDPEHLSFTVAEWASFGVPVPKALRKRTQLAASELGVTSTFDAEASEIRISIPAALRPQQTLGYAQDLPDAVSPTPKGVMVDYDIAVASQGHDLGISVGHVLRTGVTGGVLTSTGQANWTDGQSEYIRGTTTWRRDNLARGTSLQVGDVVLPNNNLNNRALLGGVRVGTDRQLSRNGGGYDIPMIGGLADTRSTAEVIVNEHQRANGEIAPGPYELSPRIAVPGLNNVEVVQRDNFGREQSYSRTFYTHRDLLRRGRWEWDVAAGAVRTNPIGNDYEGFALQATANTGLSDRWSMGATVQAGKVGEKGGRNLSLHNTVSLGRFGVVQADVSTSQRDDGAKGNAYRVGYERSSPNWSVSASHMLKSVNYWEISDLQDGPFKIRSQTVAALSIHPTQQKWQGSLTYSDIQYNERRLRQLSAMASIRNERTTWMFGGIHDLGSGDNQIFLGVRFQNSNQGYTSYSAKSAPNVGPSLEAAYSGASEVRGQDFRYQVAGTLGQSGQIYGRVDTQVAGGDLTVEARKHAGQPAMVNGRYRNSVWIGEGGILNGRGNNAAGSFVLVEVPDQAGVDIRGSGSKPVPTNGKGYALLSNISALSPTIVQLDANQIPLDQEIDDNQQVVVAPRQGGAKVIFPIKQQTTRQYEVRTKDGYAPEHASVVSDQGETFSLGTRGVLVLATPAKTATVNFGSSKCELVLPAEGGVIFCNP